MAGMLGGGEGPPVDDADMTDFAGEEGTEDDAPDFRDVGEEFALSTKVQKSQPKGPVKIEYYRL